MKATGAYLHTYVRIKRTGVSLMQTIRISVSTLLSKLASHTLKIFFITMYI